MFLSTYLLILTSQYCLYFTGEQTGGHTVNLLELFWLQVKANPTHPSLSKKENLLVHVRQMSRVRMVPGMAGSRGPNDIMRSHSHLSHPSLSLFFFFSSVGSILRQPLSSRWQKDCQQLHAIGQVLANCSPKGWLLG